MFITTAEDARSMRPRSDAFESVTGVKTNSESSSSGTQSAAAAAAALDEQEPPQEPETQPQR